MKRTGTAYLFWLILGLIGGHRYYLGRWRTGLLMTVTIGGAGVWWLIDAVLLPGMVRKVNEGRVAAQSYADMSRPASVPIDPDGEPVAWSATGFIREYPDGQIRLRVSSEEEARLAMKDLQLFRKKVSLERQGISQEMSSARAARQQSMAHRGPAMRGGGGFGRAVRSLDSMSRSMTRSAHASQLAPLQQQKEQYDAAIRELDGLVNQLEHEMLRLKATNSDGWGNA